MAASEGRKDARGYRETSKTFGAMVSVYRPTWARDLKRLRYLLGNRRIVGLFPRWESTNAPETSARPSIPSHHPPLFGADSPKTGAGPALRSGVSRLKVWRLDEPEPEAWDLSRQEPLSAPQAGCLVLVAHHVDASFGPVTVTPPRGVTIRGLVGSCTACLPRWQRRRAARTPADTVKHQRFSELGAPFPS
jgi:hypothetical protein